MSDLFRMRKCFLFFKIFIQFFLYTSAFCNPFILKSIETKVSTNLNLDSQDIKNSSTSLTSSIKTDLNALTFLAEYKIPTTNFTDVPELLHPNFVLSIPLKNICNLPITIAGGGLSGSGSIAKLKSPTLSAPSTAFSSSLSSITNLNYKSSTPKKDFSPSLFLNFYPSFKNREFNFSFLMQKESFSFSAYSKFKIKKNVNMLLNTTGGFFAVKNQNSQWFSATKYFTERLIWAQNLQFMIDCSSFKSKNILTAYQNPYDYVQFTFLSENLFSIQNCSVILSFFYNPSLECFCINDSPLKNIFQLKINPSFCFYPQKHPCKIKTGISCFLQENLDKDLESDLIYKCIASFLLQTTDFKVELTLTAQDLKPLSYGSYKINMKQTRFYKNFQAQKAFAFSFSADNITSTTKISYNLFFKTKVKTSINSSIGFSTKETVLSSIKASISSTIRFTIYKCPTTMSLGLSVPVL